MELVSNRIRLDKAWLGIKRTWQLISITYTKMQHRRSSRNHLSQLSAHQLKDIGIDTAQQHEEVNKYFWQE